MGNHINWWDGLMVFFLTRYHKKNLYCMMDELQLKHYPFFRWLGAFSVDQRNPVRAAASAHYALKLLKNPGNMLWIFPQGKMVSSYEEIKIQPGVDYLASRSGNAQLLPVAFRYEFFREEKPQVFIRVGPPYDAHDCSKWTIQASIQRQVNELADAAKNQDFSEFTRLVQPRLSINKQWEWWLLFYKGKLEYFKPEN